MLRSNSRRRKKALIIDDESDICFLLSSILRQKNIQTVFAGSLSETDQIIESADDSFGYIFIDNHLPDGLGSTYIEKIRHRFPDSRLIMITAHDTNSERQKAVKNGVDYFIGKPFSKKIILQTLEAAKTST